MHNISNLFYFVTTLYMFRMVCPSVIRSLRQVLWLLAVTEPIWHIPEAVCTVLDSWWWTERPSETSRVLFQNKINLRYCTSSWFYYRNILRCTVLQTSKEKIISVAKTCNVKSIHIHLKFIHQRSACDGNGHELQHQTHWGSKCTTTVNAVHTFPSFSIILVVGWDFELLDTATYSTSLW